MPLLLLPLLGEPSSSRAAAPQLERLFPAGLSRGTTVEISAEGRFDAWPPRVYCSSEKIRVEPLEDKGKLRAIADQDAACGIHWVRLIDDSGATAARPLIVGTCQEVAETEPNESMDDAHAVAAPVTVNGRLQKRNDVDVFAVKLAAGQQLVASLACNSDLGSPMDGVLQIMGSRGYVIQQNDDARGLDPLLVFTAPAPETYYLRVFGFPATPTQAIQFAGGKEFVYRLTISAGGFLDHTLPLAVSADGPTQLQLFGWNICAESQQLTLDSRGESRSVTAFHPQLASTARLPVTSCGNHVADESCGPASPQLASLPAVVSGRIETEHDVDVFKFAGKKGQKISARVDASALGSLLDPQLVLLDASGKQLAEVDDIGRQVRDCRLTHELPADGNYFLQLRDAHYHGGFRYFYRLHLETAEPDFALTVATDLFVVERDKDPLEFEIAISRENGFAEPIEVVAVDLPEFVSWQPVVSAAKGDTAKKVKFSLSAGGEPWSGQFELRGVSQGDDSQRRTATFSVAQPAMEFDRLWLTVK